MNREDRTATRIRRIAATLLFLVSICGVLAGQSTAAPRAGESLRDLKFIAPKSKLVTTKTTRVVVVTPPKVRSFSARANGKDVSKRFKRISPNRWAAVLTKRHGLRTGVNRVIVTTRERGRTGKSIGSHRFIVGKRSKPVASIRVKRRTGGATVVLKLQRKLDLFRVTLNGRNLTKHFAAEQTKLQSHSLSPDFGLRFGTNRLTLLAAARNGAFTRKTVAFRIARTHPLAAAGRDRHLQIGPTARLSAKRTRSTSNRVKYEWAIKRKPAGSKAKLLRSKTSRPRLRPDENGRYEIELKATSNGRTSRDRVSLSAAPSSGPSGVSLDTAAAQPGGGYAIELGASCPSNVSGCEKETYPYGDKPVQLLVVDRSTLEVTSATQYDSDAISAVKVASVISGIAGDGTSPVESFVVLASLPGSGAGVVGWNLAVQLAMGRTPSLATNGGWSAIGTPIKNGKAITGVANGGETSETGFIQGQQRGYFRFDAAVNRFAYLTGRYQQFNTAAGGDQQTTNTITVGSSSFPSSPLAAGCSGGFQVVTLRATTLDAAYTLADNQTLSTNCSDLNTAFNGAQAFTVALEAATSNQPANNFDEQNGPKLIAIQSIGQPGSSFPAVTIEFIEASQFIDKVGGQSEVFNRAMSASDSRYALVGGTAIIDDVASDQVTRVHAQEDTAQYTSKIVSLEGLLRTNHAWHYTPVTGGVGTTQSAQLTTDVYNKSEPWPAGGTTGEANALEYISKLYDIEYSPGSSCYKPVKPDVRFEYCDLTQSWGALLRDLPTRTYNKACNCSEDDWKAVVATIPQEIVWVRKIYRWVGLVQSVYGGAGEEPALLGLKKIATDVDNAVNPPPGSGAGGWWADLVANLFNALALVPEADSAAEATFEWISALSYLAEDGVTLPSGVSSLGQLIDQLASDVPDELALRYLNASENLGTFGDLAVTDYGKLKAIGTNPAIQIDENAIDTAIGNMMVGAYRFGYAKMMGAAYTSNAVMPNKEVPPSTPPQKIPCGFFPPNYPFAAATPSSWIPLNHSNPPLPYYNNGSPWMLVLGKKGSGALLVDPPPEKLLKPIFAPIVFDGNGAPTSYGEYAPWWFKRNFTQKVFLCVQG